MGAQKLSVGWFSSGRDPAARMLLGAIWEEMKKGFLPGEILYVFSSREPGESRESDYFLEYVSGLKLPLITFSARRFKPELWRASREEWRRLYHAEVAQKIKVYPVQTVVLAGYMLILSPQICAAYNFINLHPALPGGPKGTWQEVIWQLMETKAAEAGAMVHVVTPELDAGPALTYASFSLKEPAFAPYREECMRRGLKKIKEEEGEENALFQKIRAEEIKREPALLILTLRLLAQGELEIKEGQVLDSRGQPAPPRCLNREVETFLRTLHYAPLA